MKKTFTFYLSTPPYASENTETVLRMADAALSRGHAAIVIASADGIYAFMKGQKAKGITNAEEAFSALMTKGLKVML